jgi:hypothetical protein
MPRGKARGELLAIKRGAIMSLVCKSSSVEKIEGVSTMPTGASMPAAANVSSNNCLIAVACG